MPDTNLNTALAGARAAAEAHMTGAERNGTQWHEETVSEILWQGAAPQVLHVPFTKRQENTVGADWLWWWVDGSGECFGMLVQAKRLYRHGQNWSVGFWHNKGQQLQALFTAASLLEVPARYVVYLGGEGFRTTTSCGDDHTQDCRRCIRRSVSVLTALQAELAGPSPVDGASAVLSEALPLEDLADGGPDGLVFDVNLDALPEDLRAFLMQRQSGARAVARAVFAAVAKARASSFSATPGTLDRQGVRATFEELPHDRGHFHEPYYPHVLRGLGCEPPQYVQDVLDVGQPSPKIILPAAGVVVIRV